MLRSRRRVTVLPPWERGQFSRPRFQNNEVHLLFVDTLDDAHDVCPHHSVHSTTRATWVSFFTCCMSLDGVEWPRYHANHILTLDLALLDPSPRAEHQCVQDGGGGGCPGRHHPSEPSSGACGNGCTPRKGRKTNTGVSYCPPRTCSSWSNPPEGWGEPDLDVHKRITELPKSVNASATARPLMRCAARLDGVSRPKACPMYSTHGASLLFAGTPPRTPYAAQTAPCHATILSFSFLVGQKCVRNALGCL